MKHFPSLLRHLSLLLVGSAVVLACKKDIPDIGPQSSPVTGINGTWKLAKVELEDLSLPIPEKMDVSSYYTSASSQLTVQFDYASKTYQVLDEGQAINFFGNGGTWEYDNYEFPTTLTLYTSGSDTIGLNLLNMVRSYDPQMGVVLSRTKCDAPSVNYEMTFNRQ